MQLLPLELIEVNQTKIDQIDAFVKSIYRLIIYSRYHLDDDLLDIYLEGVNNLKEQLGIKNAQMEAQNEEEAKEYLKNLRISLDFVVEEIRSRSRSAAYLPTCCRCNAALSDARSIASWFLYKLIPFRRFESLSISCKKDS